MTICEQSQHGSYCSTKGQEGNQVAAGQPEDAQKEACVVEEVGEPTGAREAELAVELAASGTAEGLSGDSALLAASYLGGTAG